MSQVLRGQDCGWESLAIGCASGPCSWKNSFQNGSLTCCPLVVPAIGTWPWQTFHETTSVSLQAGNAKKPRQTAQPFLGTDSSGLSIISLFSLKCLPEGASHRVAGCHPAGCRLMTKRIMYQLGLSQFSSKRSTTQIFSGKRQSGSHNQTDIPAGMQVCLSQSSNRNPRALHPAHTAMLSCSATCQWCFQMVCLSKAIRESTSFP